MTRIEPFRALHYDAAQIGDPSTVVVQPYDKISEELQQQYYERSPYSAVRITKNQEKVVDPDTDYPDAGNCLNRWLEQRILVQDPAPALYPYYQRFEVDGETKTRKGFIGLLDLDAAGNGILSHERTMAAPKLDRLRLMRRLECNDDLIFMLYPDESRETTSLVDEAVRNAAPVLEAQDDFMVRHQVWSVSDPAVIQQVQNVMASRELYIADGHHRYETSVNFRTECMEKGWKAAAPESFHKRLVACFNTFDEGIAILPTHRLVRDLTEFDASTFLDRARESFDVHPVGSVEEFWHRMRVEQSHHVFGFYGGDSKTFHLLRLHGSAKSDPALVAKGEALKALDVTILHTLVLEKLLGINEAKLVAESHVDFARDRASCIERVDSGSHQAVFFMNPTSVEEVQRVARTGARMPQKSTDFYPKLLTGLVLMKMQIAKP